MSTESQLREKRRKIEALVAGAGTTGERLAAEAALERVRARLTELGHKDSPVEMQFSMPDQWSRHLFLALCRRTAPPRQPSPRLACRSSRARARQAQPATRSGPWQTSSWVPRCVRVRSQRRSERRDAAFVEERENTDV